MWCPNNPSEFLFKFEEERLWSQNLALTTTILNVCRTFHLRLMFEATCETFLKLLNIYIKPPSSLFMHLPCIISNISIKLGKKACITFFRAQIHCLHFRKKYYLLLVQTDGSDHFHFHMSQYLTDLISKPEEQRYTTISPGKNVAQFPISTTPLSIWGGDLHRKSRKRKHRKTGNRKTIQKTNLYLKKAAPMGEVAEKVSRCYQPFHPKALPLGHVIQNREYAIPVSCHYTQTQGRAET